MSKTQLVKYRDRCIWAYDVALEIFLKYLIDVAEPLAATVDGDWLTEAISDWRVNQIVNDCALIFDEEWPTAQIDVFICLADRACRTLGTRDRIPSDEITEWPLLDDHRIFMRGATEVFTAPVAELGRAIISLLGGTLPPAPFGTMWCYGCPEGRVTIPMG